LMLVGGCVRCRCGHRGPLPHRLPWPAGYTDAAGVARVGLLVRLTFPPLPLFPALLDLVAGSSRAAGGGLRGGSGAYRLPPPFQCSSPCPCFDRTTIGRQQLPHLADDCRLRSLLAGLLDCAHTPLPAVGCCPSWTAATPLLCRRPRPSSVPTASSPPALSSLCWWSGSLPRVGDRNTLPSVNGRDPSSALVATTPYPG
jgi:hypothetical protein